MDTICAVASAAGGGRRAVIRLSGPAAATIVAAACPGVELSARGLACVEFHDGVGTQPVLLLWMPAPRSYTGEDVAELHLLGSPPLVRAALGRLVALGARPARGGEFTRRAFENGRLDLTRAEGVAELIAARSREERRAATALLSGGLGGRVARLRDALVDLRALTEASLDFDEGATGEIPTGALAARARELMAAIEEARAWEARRVPASGLARVTLVGAPNAGKSSLFNALTGGGGGLPALVSPQGGTTRDVKSATWLAGGAEVELFDTAGEEPARGEAESLAQERRRRQVEGADLVLGVVDAVCPRRVAGADLLAWNKLDLPGAAPPPEGPPPVVGTSARTGLGLEELGAAVARALATRSSGLSRSLGARHLAALEAAGSRLETALAGLEAGETLDLFAEGLREVTDALDGISGLTTPEDLLDRIFAHFCLGK